jgi:SAM-dependent methyltransferase
MMIKLIKDVLRFFLKKPVVLLRKTLNGMGEKRKCYVCKRTFHHFTKFRGGKKKFSGFLNSLQMVGSDLDNFGCMYCNSHDRERHLFMFFDKLILWEKFKNSKIIHIAPESNLRKKIEDQSPNYYVLGDLNPDEDNKIIKIDITDIQFNDNTFDFFICNHVLEHVHEIHKALSEIFRVLKTNGLAVLQTPYSKLLNRNFEEENINTDKLRIFFYGQEDHVRLFSEKQFLAEIEKAGFILQIQRHNDFFDDTTSKYFGVNINEDLILVKKPATII